jgi:hypothetical protein
MAYAVGGIVFLLGVVGYAAVETRLELRQDQPGRGKEPQIISRLLLLVRANLQASSRAASMAHHRQAGAWPVSRPTIHHHGLCYSATTATP